MSVRTFKYFEKNTISFKILTEIFIVVVIIIIIIIIFFIRLIWCYTNREIEAMLIIEGRNI
jgi:sensor histidine kinase regulating citrate/malate metabolism